VDLMVASELQPSKLELTSNTGIIFGVVDIFDGTKGFALVQAFAPIEPTTHFGGAIDLV
jgi:hypothetical protein